MRTSWCVGACLGAVAGLAIAGCSDGDDAGTAPTLPAIATTIPASAAPTLAAVTTTLPFYEVQSGDTLYAIAAAYRVPVQAILNANPELTSPDDIAAGQFLAMPTCEHLVMDQLPPTVPGQTAPTMPGPTSVAPTSTP